MEKNFVKVAEKVVGKLDKKLCKKLEKNCGKKVIKKYFSRVSNLVGDRFRDPFLGSNPSFGVNQPRYGKTILFASTQVGDPFR